MSGTVDARPMAWLSAENCLNVAQRMADAVAKEDGLEAPLPARYWGLLAAADTWARLAQCSTAVGHMTGSEVSEREREKQEERRRSQEDFAEMLGRTGGR